jgi:hypothetical protein
MKIIKAFRNFNAVLSLLTVVLVIATVLLLIFDKKCKGCKEINVGVIQAVEPFPSSFNSKTEIKMEKTFYIVFGFPQLQIGDLLIARIDGKKIVSIKDNTEEWYDVLHKTK